MEALKQRIRQSGRALNSQVLLVDMFLNNQVDCALMDEIGAEFKRLFEAEGVTKVVTIESSGIAPAAMTALRMGAPMIILKKATSVILSDGILQTEVFSFTKRTSYQLTLKTEFIQPGDRVLLIDDFLANGAALQGLIKLVNDAGATLVGAGICVEKAFQPGGELIRSMGVRVESLARVKSLSEENGVEFC